MKLNKTEMDKKLEKTVEKTIEAIARIQRFVVKYGSQLSNDQKERIMNKIKELQKYL
ncbi:hypothetical protein KBB48_03135 [Candidatus Shapirobacteria bacterium]|nr:hypothetical protein [Candidatus Shapirobacteria bacterium]